jgi:hypothetical protein
MVIAEARIETERPSRYLVQLCQHISNISSVSSVSSVSSKARHLRQGPRVHLAGQAQAQGRPEVPHVEWSQTRGSVSFGGGRLTMEASPGALNLRAEADGEGSLEQVQDLVTERLERFGRRDHLKVNWQRPEAPASIHG